LQHADDVLAVLFFTHEQSAFHVLRLAARLDDVAVGILSHELNRRIEGIEVLVGNDVDAGLLQLLLSERAVVLQAIGIFGAADDRLASGAEGLSFGALAQGIVKDNDIGPLDVILPVGRLGNEPVGNVALFLVVDVIADLVALLEDLPSDIAD